MAGNTVNRMLPTHSIETLRVPPRFSPGGRALEFRVPAPRVNDSVRKRRAVTPDTALRVSRYFGTSPEFWMDLQTVSKSCGAKIEAESAPRAA